jgi:hypothetical protein
MLKAKAIKAVNVEDRRSLAKNKDQRCSWITI